MGGISLHINNEHDLHRATTHKLVIVFMPWYLKTIENTQKRE